MITLDDLMDMDGKALHGVLLNGHPLDPDALAGNEYLGVDLSLPNFARKLLWHTFRKAFVYDEQGSGVRGWNVRMEQHGSAGARVPMRDRRGRALTFGHYHVRPRGGARFPGGYEGTHLLDYGVAGNPFFDLARLGYTPLVAVNEGSQELLLGWELLRVCGLYVPLPLYWALRYEGPVSEVVKAPARAESRSSRSSKVVAPA